MSAPANAAIQYGYIGYAGGTLVKALGTTISSDLTSQSSISGGGVPNSQTNTVASVKAGSTLLSTGAVNTSVSATAFGDGVKLTSFSRTLGVNLLNGLIKADAVETTTFATSTSTGQTSGAQTKFVNLKILGVNLPVTIPNNFTVTVPGVATVILNAYQPGQQGTAIANIGYGLGVGLLKPTADAPLGTSVILNPTYTAVVQSSPLNSPTVGGYAFGSRVQVKAGQLLNAEAGPSAQVGVPTGGSQGGALVNNTAAVNLPGILTTAAIGSKSTSSTGPGFGEVTTQNEIAGLNVLSGLVTADVIKVVAHSKKSGATYSGDMKMTLLNLKVAGTVIPLNVSPNTVIDVAGIAKVTINQQVQVGQQNQIRGVLIVLTTAQAGLPVGAQIELAVAASWINGG